jgi:hypothetical protein
LCFKVLFMKQNQEPIQQLAEIRDLMERSSRFISLSGFSGVFAGIFALAGAGIAFFWLDFDQQYFRIHRYFLEMSFLKVALSWHLIIIDAIIVLALALLSGAFFSIRNSRKKGLKIWDRSARRMLINLMIPLLTGGIFCLILWHHRMIFFIPPVTLLFYGLALVNASKYTYSEVRILGISELVLGLMASFFIGYGLLFWAFGFGVLHIIYGLVMYFKYEVIRK